MQHLLVKVVKMKEEMKTHQNETKADIQEMMADMNTQIGPPPGYIPA
jgi:hypothetical protein